MDLDELEMYARDAAAATAKVHAATHARERYDANEAARAAWEDLGECGEDVVALIARVRAAEAERDRLRALFDDAGQGEHDVLALVDHYQEEARQALAERAEVIAWADVLALQAYSTATNLIQADEDGALDALGDVGSVIVRQDIDRLLEIVDERPNCAHRAESGER